MEDGVPSVERFGAGFDETLNAIHPTARSTGLRVFGEMVDLLWKDGNSNAALRLEELWNDRAKSHEMSLLCTYAMRGFPASTHAGAIAAICRQHSRVTPTERFIEHGPSGRRTQVVLLQQRAQALETEIGYRKQLESRLRKAAVAAKRAKTAADVASRAKSQFLAVMSHELRTPLSAIGGYTELLEMGIHGPVSDDQRDSLARIQRNQRHLLSLINQVLDYSKLETGILRYEIGPVILTQVLEAVELRLAPKMTAKGLRYVASTDKTLIASADRDKLQQILFNLLTNAIKFTPPGGTIEVDCFADGARVYVNVRDTGVGIPEERLATIFDPFVQGETGYTRSSDGIGLGLAISRELARGMSGALTAASVVDSGSTFTLALPRLVR
jgi:signal transduction histidine kinase